MPECNPRRNSWFQTHQLNGFGLEVETGIAARHRGDALNLQLQSRSPCLELEEWGR